MAVGGGGFRSGGVACQVPDPDEVVDGRGHDVFVEDLGDGLNHRLFEHGLRAGAGCSISFSSQPSDQPARCAVIHSHAQIFLVRCLDTPAASSLVWGPRSGAISERTSIMPASRKPLAKVEGRKRLRLSGLTIAWRGTPDLDDWVAYIVTTTKSKKLILADQVSERKVKALMSRVGSLSRRGVEKLAKG